MFDAFKNNIHASSHESWPQLDHNCHRYPLMKPWPKLGGRRRYLTDVNNRMMDCELSRELEAQGGREGGASQTDLNWDVRLHLSPIAECQQDITRPQRRLHEVQQALINASDHFLFVSLVTESHTLRPGPIPTTNAGSAARLVVAHLEDAPVLYPREGRTLLCLHIFAGHICLVTDIYSENMETYMQNYANSNDNNINNNRHLQHQHLITPQIFFPVRGANGFTFAWEICCGTWRRRESSQMLSTGGIPLCCTSGFGTGTWILASFEHVWTTYKYN